MANKDTLGRLPGSCLFITDEFPTILQLPAQRVYFSIVFDRDNGHDEVNGSEWSL